MNAPVDSKAGVAVFNLTLEEVRQIVAPLMETSLFVMGVQHNTRRQQMLEQTDRLMEAKRKLADLLCDHHRRPFWPERFFNFSLWNSMNSGWFDINFSERTPSKEGPILSHHRVRLMVGSKNVLEKFVDFTESNNPKLRGKATVPQFDLAREVLLAVGI